jgi:hypothetical protein
LVSRPRIRNRYRPPRWPSSMSRSRACWATHSPAGCEVALSTWTRRLATSITNRAYSRCGKTVSAVKKSTASTPLACARRNRRQETARARSGGAAAARAQPARPGRPSRAAAGSPGGAAPRPRDAARAAQRSSRPSSAPAARATAVPGRPADSAHRRAAEVVDACKHARTEQSSRRICVEHAIAEHKHWRSPSPAASWPGMTREPWWYCPRSVPQIALARTLSSSSPGPGAGTGRSSKLNLPDPRNRGVRAFVGIDGDVTTRRLREPPRQDPGRFRPGGPAACRPGRPGVRGGSRRAARRCVAR